MERMLLLSPPSLAAHPERLKTVLDSHARYATDLQMLDRLAAGLVSLPESTYDIVMLLTDAGSSRTQSHSLMGRGVIQSIVRALRPGGKLQSDDGILASPESPERTELILAGLVFDGPDALIKPDFDSQHAVPLKQDRHKPVKPVSNITASADGVDANMSLAADSNSRTNGQTAAIQGVGFVDFDELAIPGGDYNDQQIDDEFIDEETLLDEADMERPIVLPLECRPKAGKRRRACKDCTCGLAEKLQDEDQAKRANADAALETMKLGANELAEVDFTVQGKLGSCGNCALGDAFRCDGCPYIGLPPFKPGEEVRLLSNDVQL
ncbi:electron carrier [Emydomyces testavorans]|uniref:Electron carrier n=1 Tax=Emydomyces testavorans TaxID=2070801 RepID=A0AAF0DBT3_9EURO|nr:electron carrier [Emydomyces testavorans]